MWERYIRVLSSESDPRTRSISTILDAGASGRAPTDIWVLLWGAALEEKM